MRAIAMAEFNDAEKKWYEKYLPFVAKSSRIQVEWLATQLSRLSVSRNEVKGGVLSCEEIRPYIRLLLENCNTQVDEERVMPLLEELGEVNLLLMMKCADVYDIPKLFRLLQNPTKEMAIMALKKVPPPYEKNPLLVIDRVFLAIREKSLKLLDESAEAVKLSSDQPINFSDNFERFKEIMMDEHVLSLLYPKAK